MHTLFGGFYDAIVTGRPTPVAHDDAIRTTRVMDAVFDSCRRAADTVSAPRQLV
jgi:hypothetical protein